MLREWSSPTDETAVTLVCSPDLVVAKPSIRTRRQLWFREHRDGDHLPLSSLERSAGNLYRWSVSTLSDRLAQTANTSTLRLTHYGRKTGKPYEVTIWFMVEGETVYLPTANRKRQWPRNVVARPEVKLQIGNQTFNGRVEEITDRAGIERVTNLMARKYWYTWPYVALARLFGWQVPGAVFRVHVQT